MKKYLLLIANLSLGSYCIGQTNTFPASGNVGIGTTSPSAGLQLGLLSPDINSKQLLIPGTYNFEQMRLGHLVNGNMFLEMVNHAGVSTSYGVRLTTNVDEGGIGLQFQTAVPQISYDALQYQPRMFISAYGNVGIGTTSPNSKLAVNGNIRAKEIKVENANWPDFVFAKSYTLPTLKETENHIKEKGHLPGIPCAAEVKANGIDLGDMNAKLLQKIEELTLHLIEKDKTEKKHEEEIRFLKQQVAEIINQIKQ